MIPILDNGHGGVIKGVYQTPGKRSPKWGKGVLYEGMFNRWIINGVIKELDMRKIPYYHASPELVDVPLDRRVERANSYYQETSEAYFFSLHANAGGGTGWEIYTSPGETKSDQIAECFAKGLSKYMPINARTDMSDGDMDKEAKFLVLMNTHCPAVLLEAGFMDFENDYDLLWDQDFHKVIIKSIVCTMEKMYYEGLKIK